MIALLAALIQVFPEVLHALNPTHPITLRVKAILPQRSASDDFLGRT